MSEATTKPPRFSDEFKQQLFHHPLIPFPLFTDEEFEAFDLYNEREAKHFTRIYAEALLGDHFAQNSLGGLFYDGYELEYSLTVNKDEFLAKFWYQQAANQGCFVSKYALAYCFYENPYSDHFSRIKAFSLYHASAKAGYPPSQFEVGWHYLYGHGVKKDLAKSWYWLFQSANKKYYRAQYFVALFYEKGIYHEKNHVKANGWKSPRVVYMLQHNVD